MLLTENKLRLIIKEEFNKLLNEGEVVSFADYSSKDAKEKRVLKQKFNKGIEDLKSFAAEVSSDWVGKYGSYREEIEAPFSRIKGPVIGSIGRASEQELESHKQSKELASKQFHDELFELTNSKIMSLESMPRYILELTLTRPEDLVSGEKIPSDLINGMKEVFVKQWPRGLQAAALDYFNWFIELCKFYFVGTPSQKRPSFKLEPGPSAGAQPETPKNKSSHLKLVPTGNSSNKK